jgi:hypothetical protein
MWGNAAERGKVMRDLGSFDRKTQQTLALMTIVILCAGYVLLPQTDPLVGIDHIVFRQAYEQMRAGSGYYEAMDGALRAVYGPSETLRAFRMPTVFLLWRCLPQESWLWVLFVILAGITGWAFLRLGRTPLAAPLVVIYLLATARYRGPQGLVAQFMLTELWAVPALAGAALAWQRDRRVLAAALSLLAVLIRETTAVIILGGLIAAHRGRHRRWPWVAAGLAALGAYCLHAFCVWPYLVPPGAGKESPLLGTADFPDSMLRMVGFGLPGGQVTGLILWTLAARWIWRWKESLWFPGIFLTLPLTGLILDRPYWGILVVPFTMAWGIDSAIDLYHRLYSQADAFRRRRWPRSGISGLP